MRDSSSAIESVEEELKSSINGYVGYKTPKERNLTDTSLREYLSKQLESINKRLPLLESQLSQRSGQNHKETLHRIGSSIAMMLNPLLQPCYIAQPFFNQPELHSEKLLQLYDYDKQIKEYVELLLDESHQAGDDADATETLDFLNHLYDFVDGINQSLTEREFLIMTDETI